MFQAKEAKKQYNKDNFVYLWRESIIRLSQ